LLVSRKVEDVVITVYDEDYDHVIARLADEGIFHVAEPPRDVKGSIDKSISHAFALAGEYSSRIAGFFTALGREPETVEDAYEPFLLQSGLMKRTPRGRMATEHAYVHLGLDPPADPQGKLI